MPKLPLDLLAHPLIKQEDFDFLQTNSYRRTLSEFPFGERRRIHANDSGCFGPGESKGLSVPTKLIADCLAVRSGVVAEELDNRRPRA